MGGIEPKRAGVIGAVVPVVAMLLACFGGADDPALVAMADGRVVYAQSSAAGQGLYLYRSSGPEVLVAPGERLGSVVWSPDGRRVAYSVRDAPLRAVTVGEGQIEELTGANGYGASWSVDGDLAWLSGGQVWTRTAEGTASAFGASGSQVRYAPTGDHLAVLDGGTVEIWSRAGDQVARSSASGVSALHWSPSGDELLLVGSTVSVLGVDGAERDLPAPVGSYGHPGWSPDGARVSYTVMEPGNSDWPYLTVQAADGTNRDERWERGYDFEWSPDGTALLYYFGGHLWVTRVDGSGRAQLTRGDGTATEGHWRPGSTP